MGAAHPTAAAEHRGIVGLAAGVEEELLSVLARQVRQQPGRDVEAFGLEGCADFGKRTRFKRPDPPPYLAPGR